MLAMHVFIEVFGVIQQCMSVCMYFEIQQDGLQPSMHLL